MPVTFSQTALLETILASRRDDLTVCSDMIENIATNIINSNSIYKKSAASKGNKIHILRSTIVSCRHSADVTPLVLLLQRRQRTITSAATATNYAPSDARYHYWVSTYAPQSISEERLHSQSMRNVNRNRSYANERIMRQDRLMRL